MPLEEDNLNLNSGDDVVLDVDWIDTDPNSFSTNAVEVATLNVCTARFESTILR